MISLNLLPDIKKDLIKAQRQRNLVVFISIVITIAAGSILALMLGFMGTQQIQKSLAESSIKKSEATLKEDQDKKQLNEYMTVKNQLDQITTLKKGQPVYSKLFDYLKDLNPAEPNSVTISSARISGSATGSTAATASATSGNTITLEGKTTNYATLDVYKNTLIQATITYTKASDESDSATASAAKPVTEKLFKTVVVGNAAISSGGGDSSGRSMAFTITLTYNDAAFALDSKDISVKVPQMTVNDSTRNAPKATFDDTGNDTSEGGK